MGKTISFKIKNVEGKADTCIIEFNGEIDAGNSNVIIDEIFPLIEKGKLHLIGDLSNLEYINSSGIYNLLRCYTKVKEKGGYFKIVDGKQPLQEILEALGVTRLMPFCETVDEALQE